MQHANASLTPNGGLRMVLLVEEEGFTCEAAAAASHVAKSTCWGWVRRWRQASERSTTSARALHTPHQREGRALHQTLMREWANALQYASSDARRQALPHWTSHYNERRTHSALGNQPPRARVQDITGHNN
jgi:transposase InsO family protein